MGMHGVRRQPGPEVLRLRLLPEGQRHRPRPHRIVEAKGEAMDHLLRAAAEAATATRATASPALRMEAVAHRLAVEVEGVAVPMVIPMAAPVATGDDAALPIHFSWAPLVHASATAALSRC